MVARMSKRDPHRAVLGRLGGGLLTLFFAAEMIVVARAGHALPGIPILALLGAPFALFAACGVARLSIDDGGVRIVNVRRSLLIGWNEIERFSLGRHGLLRKVGIAHLRGGRRIAIWGIQGPNAVRRRSHSSALRLVTVMNAELVRRRRAAALELEPKPKPALRIADPAAPPTRHLRLVDAPGRPAPGRPAPAPAPATATARSVSAAPARVPQQERAPERALPPGARG